MTNKNKKFSIKSIKTEKKVIEQTITYTDGREPEVIKLGSPTAGDVVEIRRALSNYVKASKETGEDNWSERLAGLCLKASVYAAKEPDDNQYDDVSDDEWEVLIMYSGGGFSDVALTSMKLCGFHDVAKINLEIKDALNKVSPDFNPEVDNTPF